MNQTNTKIKILKATLSIISEQGLQKVTIRRVAKKAGVNIAAVNYHFRNKKNMVDKALKMFGQLSRDALNILDYNTLSMEEKLWRMATNITEHFAAYPGFVKTFIAQIINNEKPQVQAVKNLKRGRQQVLAIMKHYFKDETPETCNIKMFQYMSAILYPIILGKYTSKLYEIDFTKQEGRQKYLKELFKNFGIKGGN